MKVRAKTTPLTTKSSISNLAPNAGAPYKAAPLVNSAALKNIPEFQSKRHPSSLSGTSSGTATRFNELVSIFKATSECVTEIEDPIPLPQPSSSTPATDASITRSVVLSSRTFSAALTCPKKFFLTQYRPDLLPRETIGEAVRHDDAANFTELARRWDRLQFGSKAILIEATDFETAQQQTEKMILDYFASNASLGEQAPTLTLHRPAFAGPCPHPCSSKGSTELLLRARPLVVRYRPKDNQWVILLAQPVVDPMSTSAKASYSLQRIHFAMRAFRNWVTQPHIPITIRKRFIEVNPSPNAPRSGAAIEASSLVAPIDVKRSGILHIRQFFPGPVSVLDSDPQKLVKFIHRLPLEELLQEEWKAVARGAGSFDCSFLTALQPLPPVIAKRYREMMQLVETVSPPTKVRSSRSLKKLDSCEKSFFEAQQELMSSILSYYVPALVEQCENQPSRQTWLAFSSLDPNGNQYLQQKSSPAQESSPPAKKRGRKPCATASKAAPVKEVSTPEYSKHLGLHCVKCDLCPFFVEGKCLPPKVDNALAVRNHHLFSLPSSAVTKKVGWWMEGMRTIEDVWKCHENGTIKLTAPQLRYAQSLVSGKIGIHPGAIDNFFQSITYPLFVLDFEAAAYAVPPHRKALAYQSIPFQFSLDVFQHDVITETPTHYDFLHFGKGYSPNQDPRIGCVSELMRIVKIEREKKRVELLRTQPTVAEVAVPSAPRKGSRGRPSKVKLNPAGSSPRHPYDGCFLAHFAAFEKTCLEKLGQLEDKYKEEIKNLFFLDTLELFKRGVMHPNAHGSNSLKKLLPAICPDCQYGVFGVETNAGNAAPGAPSALPTEQDEQQGENAMGLYRMWHHHEGGDSIRQLFSRSSKALKLPPSLDKAERDRVWSMLRIQLLEYCSMDTRAIYEILREIWRIKEIAVHSPMKKELTADRSGWIFLDPSQLEK